MMRLLFDSGKNVQISCKLKFSFFWKKLVSTQIK